MSTPRPVKVCCIQDVPELELAIRCGAHILGFVSKMPSGWGPVADEKIAELVRHVPPGIVSMLLTSITDAEGVIEQQRRVRANALQIVDAFPLDGYAKIREACPGVSIVQACHVTGEDAIERAKALAPHVDALVLDTGSPQGADVKVLGGTGQTHDWSISARIVQAIDTPVFLAGGLKPHNVAAATNQVQPWGIDVCTGVRGDADHKPLDEAKLRAFLGAVPPHVD